MPVSETLWFKSRVQKENRVQIPVEIRWKYKLEPGEILNVKVCPVGSMADEDFFARLQKGGRITIPWLVVELLKIKPGHVVSVGLRGLKEK